MDIYTSFERGKSVEYSDGNHDTRISKFYEKTKS